ncbi:MAG: glycogen debranching enzyme N-terminal domain-containing protein [Candidatus Omnitrophica bacterium]|nr:glycogen debranching enzyme N-terminal domain-containing protein [Candidatus Omnitrophota bacterium]
MTAYIKKNFFRKVFIVFLLQSFLSQGASYAIDTESFADTAMLSPHVQISEQSFTQQMQNICNISGDMNVISPVLNKNKKRENYNAVVDRVEMDPFPGENIAIAFGENFEVTVTVYTKDDTDPESDDLRVVLWTDLSPTNYIQIKNITMAENEDGTPNPRKFYATIKIKPKAPGAYNFTAFAKTKHQPDNSNMEPVFVADKGRVHVQVHQIPHWADRNKLHPYYLFLEDVATDGHSLNWTGIEEFIKKTSVNTGKNMFVLSPFFPTPGSSSFSPLSVFALSPRLIDWIMVKDKGATPIEKFRNFLAKGVRERKMRFENFKDNQEIKNYAELIAQRTIDNNGDAVYGSHYDIHDFKNIEEFKGFIIYEQFVNLEQMHEFLASCRGANVRICGDLPFYRAKDGVDAEFNRWYFDAENGEIVSPGHKGLDQMWGDLAAWDEKEINKFTREKGYDPRLLPFKYWNEVFWDVFKDSKDKVSGWRMDALHMYGRGSYNDNAERLVHDTLFWDDVAEFFMNNNLFPIVEQLGADAHAFNYFLKRKGFVQYAIVLDLKSKSLNDFIRDLENISRGLAVTVVDTHDSNRWAKEYMNMFESLTGKTNLNQDPEVRDEILKLVGPAFFTFLYLAPKMECFTLSLSEFSTQDSIKRETFNERGTVIGSDWGTKEKGNIDFSPWIKKFAQIREENPAISNSAFVRIANNDPEHLLSAYKSYDGNNILIMANFSGKEKTIEFNIPRSRFKLGAASWITCKDLISEENVLLKNHVFRCTLPSGGLRVLRLESAEGNMQKWMKDNFLPYTGLYRYFDIEKRIQKAFSVNGVFYEQDIKDILTQKILDEPLNFVEWNWQDYKNKEVMLHSGDVLTVKNPQPFTIYLKKEGHEKERIMPSFAVKGNAEYMNMLFGLTPGKYTLSFYWPNQEANHGWESQDYHFQVLPEAADITRVGKLDELTIKVGKKDLAKYPHSSVTLANGRGSILRVPVRPLKRNQWDGTIEVAGFTSKYDGFQANLMANAPDESRKVIFRGTVDDVTLSINGQEKSFHLDMDNFDNFARYPLPRWRFVIKDGDDEVIIDKIISLLEKENRFIINYKVVSATSGVQNITLFSRPDLNMRNHHETVKHWPGAVQHWDSKQDIYGRGFRVYPLDDNWKHWYQGFDGINMITTTGNYSRASEWHYSPDPIEGERGQDAVCDAYSPGFFTIPLSAVEGKSGSIVFSCVDALTPYKDNFSEEESEILIKKEVNLLRQRLENVKNPEARKDIFVQEMVAGVWPFVAKRDQFYTVIAGYPWFSDWGRDTFLCYEGLLSAGMYDIAKGLLMAFGKFENQGMLPNIITGETAGNWDTVDAPLLYVLSVLNYIRETGDSNILNEVTGDRTILEIIESIKSGYCNGTPNGIAMDHDSKLIWSPSHYTWMDTNFPAATPRQGYTVENNARWYDVLKFLSGIYEEKGNSAKALEYENLAKKVKDSFNKYFWIDRNGGYLADVIESGKGQSPKHGRQDAAIRPNQLVAVLSPYSLLSKERQIKTVDIVTRKLLVPGGLRTLSEDTASSHEFPYRGHYEGDEDSQRKQAYHNGTVWPHLFGDWALAYVTAHDFSDESIKYVLPYFAPLEEHLREAGVGSVSEVRDGNYPHWPRGCSDQAWSVAMNLAAYMHIRYAHPISLDTVKHSEVAGKITRDQMDNVTQQKTNCIDRSI